ncbi:MAG: nucleotidyltransferase [Clostridiales bacterium]|nr:nucleotidyltransferase [Clostridiales bacterium]
MQKTTLVIMAAGLGTRFGEGIKQLTPVGPNGEIIIDYSIHDALEAGFDKVVFIIRRDLGNDFKEVIGKRIEALCELDYVFQELAALPDGFSAPSGRTKPWGTGQAVLLCRNVVKKPFAVINADDYYGKEAFVKMHAYLAEHGDSRYHYCMAGFILKNTLSENGSVTRGVCQINADSLLTGIVETKHILKCPEGAVVETTGEQIDPETHVSMNMWGLTPEFFDILEDGFRTFLAGVKPGDLTAEYLLPTIIGGLLKERRIQVQVLETQDKWFGVTYAEDRAGVTAAFAKLIEDGVYSSPLNGSLC